MADKGFEERKVALRVPYNADGDSDYPSTYDISPTSTSMAPQESPAASGSKTFSEKAKTAAINTASKSQKYAVKAFDVAQDRVPLNPLQRASLKAVNKILSPAMPYDTEVDGSGDGTRSTTNLTAGGSSRRPPAPYLPAAAMPPSAYPVQGIYFFLRHPTLWANLFCPLLLFFTISIGMLLFIFIYVFPLQAAALAEGTALNEGGGWAISFFLSLIYVALITLLAFVILLPIFQEKTFHDVIEIKAKDYTPPAWAPKARKDKSSGTVASQPSQGTSSSGMRGRIGTESGRLGDGSPNSQPPYNVLYDKVIARPDPSVGMEAVYACVSGTWASIMVSIFLRLFIAIITLPINAIPVLGQGLWIYVNGLILAWEHMITYLTYRDLNFGAQRVLIMGEHRMEYAGFGMVALGLSLIPGFNWVFAFTNIVGAALWAWDAEEKDIKRWIKKNGKQAAEASNAPLSIQDQSQQDALQSAPGGMSSRKRD